MAERESVTPEHARRNLVLYSAFVAAVVAAASAVPAWLHASPRNAIDLLMQAVPPTSAAALLAGLCIGFVSLSPKPRLTLVTAVTFPAMHIALTFALAQLLSSRSSALMEPLPQQKTIQAWLATSTWTMAFFAELAVFVLAALISLVKSRRRRMNKC